MSENNKDDDLDKWFVELEESLDEKEVQRLAQAVMERHANDRNNLDRKILDDFHTACTYH